MKKAVVIGSGFAGLSAASHLARDGWEVHVFEKHDIPGGRARKFSAEGFTFDMGPSWYWMPEVFEKYFEGFGKKVPDYYSLVRLDPSYKVYWDDGGVNIPAGKKALYALFEQLEPGSSKQLDIFLKEAAFKYEVGINKLVHKPGRSLTELLDADLVKGVFKLDVFTSMKKHVQKHFSHPKLRQLLEFPVLFLGALAEDIPALYSLMNYADMALGTWYPMGGMYEVVHAMYELATELGVQFHFNSDVKNINVADGKVVSIDVECTEDACFFSEGCDVCVGSADYHFIEKNLLPSQYRSYPENYWDKRTMAPSCLLYYVGIGKKLKNIQHHSLFFDVDFERHGKDIYQDAQWPREPLFYVSATSVTDKTTAPAGCENLFFLIPIAAGLQGDSEELRDKYFKQIVQRFEKHIGDSISDAILFYKTYSVSDFINDYGAFKGNAYGLANTLMQTAHLKPALKSKKLKNMYYTGQLTVPGPGVPPSLISGAVVAKEIAKDFKTKREMYDAVVS